jgi:multisubunit Na+/H+ antiporter MnhF subunit
MNIWLMAALALMASLVICLIRCLRGATLDRLTGLETCGLIETEILLLLSEAFHRPSFYDLALAMALLALAGGLVFVHFLERWM